MKKMEKGGDGEQDRMALQYIITFSNIFLFFPSFGNSTYLLTIISPLSLSVSLPLSLLLSIYV